MIIIKPKTSGFIPKIMNRSRPSCLSVRAIVLLCGDLRLKTEMDLIFCKTAKRVSRIDHTCIITYLTSLLMKYAECDLLAVAKQLNRGLNQDSANI